MRGPGRLPSELRKRVSEERDHRPPCWAEGSRGRLQSEHLSEGVTKNGAFKSQQQRFFQDVPWSVRDLALSGLRAPGSWGVSCFWTGGCPAPGRRPLGRSRQQRVLSHAPLLLISLGKTKGLKMQTGEAEGSCWSSLWARAPAPPRPQPLLLRSFIYFIFLLFVRFACLFF